VSGGSYTLREWAGLWVGGYEPFRVGQRYLMLLHSPGAGGLSSPVGGMDGAIPIRGGGQAVGLEGASSRDAGGIAGVGASTDGLVVDLSWVGTRVATPILYRPESVGQSTVRPVLVQADVRNAVAADAGLQSASILAPANGPAAIVPIEKTSASAAKGMAYPAVLGMLRSWEKGDHGAR